MNSFLTVGTIVRSTSGQYYKIASWSRLGFAGVNGWYARMHWWTMLRWSEYTAGFPQSVVFGEMTVVPRLEALIVFGEPCRCTE